MDNLNIIDKFTETFVRYIDSGFGLLSGDVSFLTTTLVSIDVIMAGLFWALMDEDNVIGQYHLLQFCRTGPEGFWVINDRHRFDATRLCGGHGLYSIASFA